MIVLENAVGFSRVNNEASIDADAVVVLTEWEEFKSIDWEQLIKIMRQPSWIFDTELHQTDKAESLDLIFGK